MNKPEPYLYSVEMLDYPACAEYLKEKYGDNVDEFWSYLCCFDPPANGSELYLSCSWYPPIEDDKITQDHFLEEFGEGPYWVEW